VKTLSEDQIFRLRAWVSDLDNKIQEDVLTLLNEHQRLKHASEEMRAIAQKHKDLGSNILACGWDDAAEYLESLVDNERQR
jgi:hypothetical protein